MLHTVYYPGPFGLLQIQGSYLGITSLKLVDKQDPPESKDNIPTVLSDARNQLDEYFQQRRQLFDLTLDWAGHSEFNIAVWKELVKIPYGQTTSYSALAYKLNNPRAVRAVGLANRNNPIAIVVPCHRVIAKSGDLHGYFYGLDVKRQLLELENPLSFARQGSLF